MLLKLHSFNTTLYNAKVTFCVSSLSVDNRIVCMQSIVVLRFFVVVVVVFLFSLWIFVVR